MTQKQEKMQAQIIRCSKKLFEQNGYANTSIRMIAKEMGFKNQASFYIYFESKDKMTALILRRGSEKVRRFIDDLHLGDIGILDQMLLENLIITEILKDTFNRRFYTEAQAAQSFTNWAEQIPGYTKRMYKNITKNVSDISFEEFQLNLFMYIKAVCSAFQAIDNGEVSVSFHDATKRLPYVFLELMGVDSQNQQSILEETQRIFERIPKEEIEQLYFFD